MWGQNKDLPPPPANIHALILGAWEHVTLHGENHFADVIKITDLDTGPILPPESENMKPGNFPAVGQREVSGRTKVREMQ